MKKLIPVALLGTGLAYGLKYAHDWVHTALIDRNFTVPEALGKAVTETGEKADELELRVEDCRQWLNSQNLERHYIINDNGYKLTGYLLKAKEPSDIYVFGSHGYRSDGKNEWCTYGRFYHEEMGYNLFFVDHQAAGESEGKHIGFGSFESRDSLKWLDYMTETFGKDIEIILHGISMGSATVMLMTGSEKLSSNVKFTVADCGYTSALDEFNYKLKSLNFPRKPLVPVICSMNRKKIGYDFGEDTNALKAVENAKVPMLFIHGDNDKFVPTYMVYLLFDACTNEKDILIVPGADHAESYLKGTKQYTDKIKDFSEKYLKG